MRGQPRRGLLLYGRSDLERNRSYIDWLLSAAQEAHLPMELLIVDDPVILPGDARDVCADARLSGSGYVLSVDPQPVLDAVARRSAQGLRPFILNRTRSATLAAACERAGCRVFNSPMVAWLGNDKIAGYVWAIRHGLTVSPLVRDDSCDLPLVSKPVFGHGGRDVRQLTRAERRQSARSAEPALLQRPVPRAVGDVRFYVIGGETVYAVLRKGGDAFASNFSLGGSAEWFHPDAAQRETVRTVLRILPMDYAGVDFILDEDGTLWFNEIEDVVGSRMLSALGSNDTTERLLRHIAKCLQA